jgi:hypothetical protein
MESRQNGSDNRGTSVRLQREIRIELRDTTECKCRWGCAPAKWRAPKSRGSSRLAVWLLRWRCFVDRLVHMNRSTEFDCCISCPATCGTAGFMSLHIQMLGVRHQHKHLTAALRRCTPCSTSRNRNFLGGAGVRGLAGTSPSRLGSRARRR